MHPQNQISILSMSNSELFLVKDDQEGVEFHVLNRPTSQFQDDHYKCSHGTASHDTDHDQSAPVHQAAKDIDEEEKDEKCKASKENDQIKPTLTLLLGDCKASTDHLDDDDDGFRTPTSLDHKIPAIKQCPPAPRKPKQLSSTKRKVITSPNVRLDLSTEVESLFPRPVLDDLHKKIKRARREEDSTD